MKKKFQTTKSSNSIGQNIFPSHLAYNKDPFIHFLYPTTRGFFLWRIFATWGYKKEGLLSHHTTRGVSHWRLAIYIKTLILRQKKNYGNSNISPCKNIILKKKSSKRNQNPLRYHNSITNLKFQHKRQNIIIFQKTLV
jgi:hypothetical protein